MLTEFKKNDQNKEKYDPFEGAINNIYVSDGILQLKTAENEQWRDLKIFDSHFNNYINTDLILSYSLYSVTENQLSKSDIFRIDERMKEFGSHFLIIRNTGLFISAIQNFLIANNYNFKMGLVEYRDFKTSLDSISLFNKTSLLSHQNEFRILIESKGSSPLEFHIGGIEENSEIHSTGTLDKFMLRNAANGK